MHASWINLSPQQRAEFNESFGTSGWRIISRDQLPSVFPCSLRSKVDSALVITADTSTGGTYFIVSAWRLDRKDCAFDNEPFGLIVHASGASEDGVFLHHGEWEGRTQPIPDYLLNAIDSEGVGDYLWAIPPADQNEGGLLDLVPLPRPHRGAFHSIVQEIRAKVDAPNKSPAQ